MGRVCICSAVCLMKQLAIGASLGLDLAVQAHADSSSSDSSVAHTVVIVTYGCC